jgi:hypothetical protein
MSQLPWLVHSYFFWKQLCCSISVKKNLYLHICLNLTIIQIITSTAVLVTASLVFKVAVSASDCSSSDRKTNDLFACELALRGGKQYVSNCKQGEDFTRK